MNLLNKEDSPYLKQHENNPVYWNPWGEEALQRAKLEKKPIFVSIGYSTCHWCHVMEREVFEKEEFAKTLNEHFIAIKIDKEERPDIDKYYQEVYQILNKRAGGWPLSMFLTHEARPFFAGTYIPPEPRHGMIGFNQLLEVILEKYETNFDDIIKTGNTLTNMMSEKNQSGQYPLDPKLSEKITLHLKESYDEVYGGFSEAPKFPHGDSLLYILDSNDETLLEMGKNTLKKMSEGGLYDIVEGGFCRYSVDDMWLVPHFEKMLYDNGILTEVFAKAYFRYEDDYFKKVAIQSADFMITKMSEDNLFYSASDADTEGEEGKYFVYSYDELLESGIDEETLRALSVTKKGNFEGKNIVRGFTLDDTTKEILQKIRDKREYPFIDKKIVVFQNAMMIKALFALGKVDAKYLDLALKSIEKLQEEFLGEKLLRSKIGTNPAKIDGFLEDYAYFADAALVAYLYTTEEKFLDLTKELFVSAVENFYEDGLWYFSKGDFPTVADPYDNSYPSAVGILLNVGEKLSFLVPDIKEILEKTVWAYSEKISRVPFASTTFVRALYRDVTKISSNKENLLNIVNELTPLELDNIILDVNNENSFNLCSDESCFLNTEDLKEALITMRERLC